MSRGRSKSLLLESAVCNLMIVVLGEGGEAVSAVIRAARFLSALWWLKILWDEVNEVSCRMLWVGELRRRGFEVQSMVAGNADP